MPLSTICNESEGFFTALAGTGRGFRADRSIIVKYSCLRTS